MGVHLRKPSHPKTSEVFAGLAHVFCGDLILAWSEDGVRNGERGRNRHGEFGIFNHEAVDIRDLFNFPRLGDELGEQPRFGRAIAG